MSGIEFDRDAVGVSAKADWKDSEQFGQIASFVRGLSISGCVKDLPVGDNSGVYALRRALAYFRSTLTTVLTEFGDACAVLGSGQESAISDYDATEFQQTSRFREMAERLGGGKS